MGRDPATEKGGLNLYGFCGNNSINKWDVLGMFPTDGIQAELEMLRDELRALEDDEDIGYVAQGTHQQKIDALNSKIERLESQLGRSGSEFPSADQQLISIDFDISPPPIAISIGPRPETRVIEINIAFEKGFIGINVDSEVRFFQTVVDNYVKAYGGAAIAIKANYQSERINSPESGSWNPLNAASVVNNITGSGFGNIMIASSAIDSDPRVAGYGWEAVGNYKAGAVLAAHRALSTLAHEVGHMIGYDGGADEQGHHPDENNLMYREGGPNMHIDKMFYDLLLAKSTKGP